MLRRSIPPDLLGGSFQKPGKSLIGVRSDGGLPFLISKFSWGGLVSGRILRRPCFCSMDGTRAAALCPVHSFCHLARRRVAPGDPLFSAVNRGNFNRVLRAVLPKIQGPSAERYRSHTFRRG